MHATTTETSSPTAEVNSFAQVLSPIWRVSDEWRTDRHRKGCNLETYSYPES